MVLCVMDYSNELKRKKKAQNVIGVFLVNQSNKVSRLVPFLLFTLHMAKKLQSIILKFSKHKRPEKKTVAGKCFLLPHLC